MNQCECVDLLVMQERIFKKQIKTYHMQWRTNGFLERLEALGVNWPENARNISLSCPFSVTFRLSSTVFDLKILAHKLSKKIIKNAWFHLLYAID